MAEFIISPGQTGTLNDTSPTTITLSDPVLAGDLTITSLTSFEMPMSKDIYSYSTMDHKGKRQFPTTSSYTINTEIAMDGNTWSGVPVNGNVVVSGSAANLGLFGVQVGNKKMAAEWNIGPNTYTANAYVSNLSPNATPEQPVWKTPITITIDGDITKL